MRIDYGSDHEPEAALKWLWWFIEGAKTGGELYGRALVVIAAEQYASRLVVPASQRAHPARWGSHKDIARKALARLAGSDVPASVKQLEKAVARARRELDDAEATACRSAQATARNGSDDLPADVVQPEGQGEAETDQALSDDSAFGADE